MKKIILLTLISLSLSAMQIFAGTYSGGSGTSGDPYKIATTDDLIELSNTSGDWGAYFIQTSNITFDSDETQVDWDGDGTLEWPGDDKAGFSPIGNTTTQFTGNYNGDGYTISNLYIDRSSTNRIGLFGYTDGADISDIGIINCDITGDWHIGGLVGYNHNSSTVSNSYSTGSVSGTGDRVGGLVGYNHNSSTVSNSYSTGSVSGTGDRVGGLVGYNFSSSTVSNSYSNGDVSGNYYVGGLVGENNNSTVSNSYSTGDVSGEDDVGGLVGYNYNSTVSNSYSTGDVTRSFGSSSDFGGFCGYNYNSTIEYCYSIGDVNGGGWNDKGFVGDDSFGTYTDNFFDKDASNQNTDAVGAATPETTVNMKNQSTFTNWDFTNDWAMSSVISFDEYPTLQWTKAYAKTPSGGSPYLISTLPELVWIAENSGRWSNSYRQTADINMWTTPSWDGNQGWTPIGNIPTKFTGNYDGDGYTISNLYIDRSSATYIGLFGITNGATVENIGIENCDITGDNNVGGLVGYNFISSTVSNSYSTGNITGDFYVGGILGYNNSSSTVSNSYSTGNITGNFYVGGILGYNNSSTVSNSYSTGDIAGNNTVGGLLGYNNNSSTVSNSYSTGNVSGNNYVGGLMGANSNSSTVSNSYSTGDVTRATGSNTSFGGFCGYNYNSTIEYSYSIGDVNGGLTGKGFVGIEFGSHTYTDNFFDSDASNQNSDAVGAATAKTTSEMKDFNTFTGSGWDFDNNWIIGDNLNNGYPALWDGFQDSYEPTDQDSPSDGIINIRNIAELRWMSENNSSWADDFEQVNDIDAAVTEYWNSTEGFSPIGNVTTQFTGNYDGDGYTISNLFIDRSSTDLIGLFGYTDGADISEIGIENCDITGNNTIGGLVGYNTNASTISNSYSTGSVTGTNDFVGGLVGDNRDSDISNSYSTGDVSGKNYVGGLVGHNFTSTVSNSYSTGDITGDWYVGGLVGYNYNSDINSCYSTGNVNGVDYTGGLVGYNYFNLTLSNCYSFGDVTRTSGSSTRFGGFCGYNRVAVIEYCYSTGDVNGGLTGKGFVGIESGSNTYTDNFFDSDASNQSTDAVGAATPKSTNEMKDYNTFTDESDPDLDNAWDFIDDPNDDTGTNDYWGINSTDNNGYPWLEWQGFTNDLTVTPTLSTNNIEIIGNSKAKSGGEITDGGDSPITAKGVCWNTTGSPTLSDNTTNDGFGDADYESIMGDLQVNQTYYVRAYANNSYGTSYGDEKTFIYTAIPTLPEWGLIILGSLIAVFAVRKILS